MKVIAVLEATSLVFAAVFVVLLPLELWVKHRRGSLSRAVLLEMAASASPLVPTLLTSGLSLAFAYGVLSLVRPWTLLAIPVSWLSAAACFVLVDFLAYVEHVVAHKVRLYWAVGHSVHHSSPQYDQTTAFRVSFIDSFTAPLALVPAVLLGFDAALVVACFGVTVAYQQWIHTETIGSLGAFDLLLNSPANHRVHHSAEPAAIDRNFGSVLMLWDHLFGTYRREEREGAPPRYGVVHPIDSVHPWTVHTAELTRLGRDLRRAPSLAHAARCLLGG